MIITQDSLSECYRCKQMRKEIEFNKPDDLWELWRMEDEFDKFAGEQVCVYCVEEVVGEEIPAISEPQN